MTDTAPAMDGLYYFRDQPERVADGIHLISAFGNSTCIETDEGLVVVDTCVRPMGARLVEQIRGISDRPIRYVIYTHGHFDHAFGVWALLEDAERRGHPRPQVVAHELVPARFDRYLELAGQHDHINRIQFALPPQTKVVTREQFHYPDMVYRDTMILRLGGLTLQLHHAMGETDDATWVWIPERRTVCTGDLFIWSCPNIGNPFKVQRYEVEWAAALEAIAARESAALAPGHGPALLGVDAVREACLDTARALRWLHDEVVRRLNAGMWAEQILAEVQALPPDLTAKPYLRPIYGCPTFVVHGILRRYAGWFDGNPAHLFPAATAAIAGEVVRLAGAPQLLERARALQQAGDAQLALHLVDYVIDAGERALAAEAQQLKGELLAARTHAEPSFIARNIFKNGATATARAAQPAPSPGQG
ncbi:MAG TPA: alkyl sulfatase dimerization domain-containing protein [Candidatus Acidoferrales bacterium]|nr:alkyl sulfatase dimerization domain-containing protein [Candidatus Acidoferrales bacterium]